LEAVSEFSFYERRLLQGNRAITRENLKGLCWKYQKESNANKLLSHKFRKSQAEIQMQNTKTINAVRKRRYEAGFL